MSIRGRLLPGDLSGIDLSFHELEESQVRIRNAYHQTPVLTGMQTRQGDRALTINQSGNVGGCYGRHTRCFSLVIHTAIMQIWKGGGSPDFSGVSSLLVEAGGQQFHPFRNRLDYAFILHRFRDVPDAGRVIRNFRCGS